MQVLEKYFDTAFDAPDGIKKLRELILTLAMQGKLVPQDPNDQSASELLKEIEKEKYELIKQGFSKDNDSSDNSSLTSLIILPMGWEKVNISNIGFLKGGKRLPKGHSYSEQPTPYRYLTVTNMKNKTIVNNDVKYISEETYKEIKKYTISKDDIYITIAGTIGNVGVIPEIYDGMNLTENASKLIFFKCDKEFLLYLLNSNIVQEQFGYLVNKMAQPKLSLRSILSTVIPLPPLNEQKRIVEKINQLMALCDELEKLKVRKEAKKLTVHKSAINQLLDSKDESNSQNGWHFISNHFNDLYTVKENVSELRSAILQLSMQGKLVPQDLSDQPASKLLKEIEKEKKANKVKSLEPIKSESIPYDLPNGWQWVYLNDFGVWKSGSTPSRTNSAYYGGDIPWVKSGEVKQGLIKKTEETITQKALDECSLGLNPIGSVLVAMYGANIGEVGILEVEATTNQAICACRTFSQINNQFLKFLIDSLKGYFISQGAGAAQPNISRVKIINTIVPLPPFNEQQRIVEKINQLMALCNDLEKQIENSSSKQTELLNTIMSNLGK